MHQECRICSQQYDFIGHLETLTNDISFILRSVNITLKDLSFRVSRSTIKDKCKTTVKERNLIKKCQDMCSMMSTVWWSFQSRGLISKVIKLLINGSDCDTISEAEFTEIALKAHNVS